MPMHWTDDLATGDEEIDTHHQQLYATVESLHDAVRYGEMARATVALDFLQRYVTDHFATEERRMAEARYPGLKAHAELHRAFAAEFIRRRQQFLECGPRAAFVIDLSSWLATWLRDHVEGADVEMGHFIR